MSETLQNTSLMTPSAGVDPVIFQRIPVAHREWGLFGLRWIIPASLLIYALLGPGTGHRQILSLATYLSIAVVVTNLLIVILLVSEYWAPYLIMLSLLVDVGVSSGGAYISGLQLGWLGLVPVVAAGIYFGWLVGLAIGVGLVVVVLTIVLISGAGAASLLAYVPLAAALAAAGPTAALLSDGSTALDRQRRQKQQRQAEQALQASRRASEYMSVIYDMAEVLSASRLDPNRVLTSAVNFGLEGLQRVGVKTPLFGAILLFASEGPGAETVLRMARASDSILPDDHHVTVLGTDGLIAQALRTLEPVVSDAPADDPELSRFATFQNCHSVLCLPLCTGQETYGVMLIGSQESRAFRDVHVQLMYAVSNQAAASLNNAKLYVSLLEQRDRIVEVEKSARAQLAADLHDGPTQNMSAITMRLNYVRRLLDRNPENAVNELYQIEDLARRTTKEVRAMLFELRPKALDQGLEAGLEQLIVKMKETYDQNVELRVVDHCDRLLDTHATQTLFSIVVEALNNARKHAEATLIRVGLGVRQDMLMLVIQDNGRGFDVEQALAEARRREGHLGLINLFERVALVDGTLHIESKPGNGTRLTVAIPLETLRQRRADEMQRLAETGNISAAAS